MIITFITHSFIITFITNSHSRTYNYSAIKQFLQAFRQQRRYFLPCIDLKYCERYKSCLLSFKPLNVLYSYEAPNLSVVKP